MKVSKKILSALASTAVVTASAITIASCACKSTEKTHIFGAETDIYIVGNEISKTFKFTLDSALETGQYLETDLEDTDQFSFTIPVVENRLVSIVAIWYCQDAKTTVTCNKDITFTCKNENGTTAWTQKITNCKVSYSPYITLESEKDMISEDISGTDNNILKCQYQFKLGEELSEIYELKPYFTLHASSSAFTIDEENTKMVVSGTTAYLNLVIKKDTPLAAGDKFSFDLQIECVYKSTIYTAWQSTKMSNMSVSYIETEVDIPTSDFITETDPTKSNAKILTGIKSTSKIWDANSNVNTLLIPAASSGLWIRQVGDGTNTINLPSNIKKIKIEGIGVQKFAANCFKGNQNIKYLDLTAITNSVQSLDTLLELDTDSFSGWADTGTVIFNKDLTQYKRHLVKAKLYKAGLTKPYWFGITVVENISALREAAYAGGNIQLGKDIEITPDEDFNGQVNFYTSSILDLNGHEIRVVNRPIFNSVTCEFAVIGVWDAELLVTDSSDSHNGAIKAFDNSSINNPEASTTKPTVPGITDNNQWEWLPKEKRYRTRENRTFYVRSDIPTRSKGTLEIVAGKFYGNCTCVMNWNTTVYIEDWYSNQSTTTPYVGEYAPQFHLYSGYCSDAKPWEYKTPCHEMLNCKEDTCKSGEATFEVWGGKFMAKDASDGNIDYFNPANACDTVPVINKTTGETSYVHANWCQTWDKYGDFVAQRSTPIQKGDAATGRYYLAVPAGLSPE